MKRRLILIPYIALCAVIYLLAYIANPMKMKLFVINNSFLTVGLKELDSVVFVDSDIFFLETNDSKEYFSTQAECAFESAALRNRNANVFVVASTGSNMRNFSWQLANLPNLYFIKTDFKNLTEGTELQVRVHHKVCTRTSSVSISDLLAIF